MRTPTPEPGHDETASREHLHRCRPSPSTPGLHRGEGRPSDTESGHLPQHLGLMRFGDHIDLGPTGAEFVFDECAGV